MIPRFTHPSYSLCDAEVSEVHVPKDYVVAPLTVSPGMVFCDVPRVPVRSDSLEDRSQGEGG